MPDHKKGAVLTLRPIFLLRMTRPFSRMTRFSQRSAGFIMTAATMTRAKLVRKNPSLFSSCFKIAGEDACQLVSNRGWTGRNLPIIRAVRRGGDNLDARERPIGLRQEFTDGDHSIGSNEPHTACLFIVQVGALHRHDHPPVQTRP